MVDTMIALLMDRSSRSWMQRVVAVMCVGAALSCIAHDPSSPNPPLGRASLALSAVIDVARAADLSVRIVAATLDGAVLADKTFALTDLTDHALQLDVDLVACLAAAPTCRVRLTLSLLASGGSVLDEFTTSPVTVSPDAENVVNEPVVLREVHHVTITPLDLEVPVGGSLQLQASPRNALNEPVVRGGATWTSSAPTIAAVSPNTGLVTALAPGTAILSASVGGRTESALVTVFVGGFVRISSREVLFSFDLRSLTPGPPYASITFGATFDVSDPVLSPDRVLTTVYGGSNGTQLVQQREDTNFPGVFTQGGTQYGPLVTANPLFDPQLDGVFAYGLRMLQGSANLVSMTVCGNPPGGGPPACATLPN